MFEEVEARRRRLDAFRPFGPGVKERLDAVFEPWFIYGSNAIEGNTLTLGDTIYLIREGKLPAGKTEEEYLEVKGQQAAFAYLNRAVMGGFQLTEKLVREFHQLLTEQLNFEKYRPGQYKDRDNQVLLSDGRVFPYVSHVDTPSAMQSLVDWHNGEGQSLHPLERAAWLHYKFILIHPFRDGNGRTSRLLANLTLLQAGYVMTVFRAEERRRQYLDALRAVDTSVPLDQLRPDNPKLNVFPFVAHFEQELLWSYDLALDVLEGRTPVTADDLIRRFGRLDRSALSTAGMADEAARLSAFAEAVDLLTARITGTTKQVSADLNQKWTELRFRTSSQTGGAKDILDARRAADLGMETATVRGRAGLVRAYVSRPSSGLVQLEVPGNELDILIFAEPHRLVIASIRAFWGTGGGARQVATENVSLATDPVAWRQEEVEGFVVAQLGLFLAENEKRIQALNGGSTG